MSSVSERWRPVPGYEGSYEVSDRGRVRGCDRLVPYNDTGRYKRWRGKILKPGVEKWGYQHVTLFSDGKRRLCKVHRLVAEAFLGPCPPGLQVNHKNRNKSDNRVENLEYVTSLENIRHAHSVGPPTKARGETHALAKLTPEIVKAIRDAPEGRHAASELARRYGVHVSTIYRVRKRKRWKHL